MRKQQRFHMGGGLNVFSFRSACHKYCTLPSSAPTSEVLQKLKRKVSSFVLSSLMESLNDVTSQRQQFFCQMGLISGEFKKFILAVSMFFRLTCCDDGQVFTCAAEKIFIFLMDFFQCFCMEAKLLK